MDNENKDDINSSNRYYGNNYSENQRYNNGNNYTGNGNYSSVNQYGGNNGYNNGNNFTGIMLIIMEITEINTVRSHILQDL